MEGCNPIEYLFNFTFRHTIIVLETVIWDYKGSTPDFAYTSGLENSKITSNKICSTTMMALYLIST
jgi:hypothetical protein